MNWKSLYDLAFSFYETLEYICMFCEFLVMKFWITVRIVIFWTKGILGMELRITIFGIMFTWLA